VELHVGLQGLVIKTIQAEIRLASAPRTALSFVMSALSAVSTAVGGWCGQSSKCGEVVQGKSDEELPAAVQVHISRDHPELVGKLSQEDILSMAVEED
jgi:hypothetical protein